MVLWYGIKLMRQNFDMAVERPLLSRFSSEINYNYCTSIAHWYMSLPTLEYPDRSSETPPPGNSTLRKKGQFQQWISWQEELFMYSVAPIYGVEKMLELVVSRIAATLGQGARHSTAITASLDAWLLDTQHVTKGQMNTRGQAERRNTAEWTSKETERRMDNIIMETGWGWLLPQQTQGT